MQAETREDIDNRLLQRRPQSPVFTQEQQGIWTPRREDFSTQKQGGTRSQGRAKLEGLLKPRWVGIRGCMAQKAGRLR